MSRRKPRPPLDQEIQELYDTHPRSAEWSSFDIAEHLGRNEASVKVNPVFRRAKAEAEGSPLNPADMRVMVVLVSEEDGDGPVPSKLISSRLGISQIFARRRLSALVKLGYAVSYRGDFSGYRATDEGRRIVRDSQPRERKKRHP